MLGLGNIGSKFAELASGFGMQIQYWSRSDKNSKFSYVTLDELFKSSELLYVSLPENAETNELITDERIKMMQKCTFNIFFIT
ncbi:MAG: NAD(P)-dependent oxidoreductase [Candidatus Dojkabacteria bacterium]|nr:NAD(P)-dependent oxidoreductase [Candidatus Dojkabacteria bacterium]